MTMSDEPRMTWLLIGTILISVFCTSLAQISLKQGMSLDQVQLALSNEGAFSIVFAVITSPMVWLGLLLYGCSAVMWLFVLAKLQVSVAYAYVALGFLLTMILGFVFLGEPITFRKLTGTCFVMLGIWLVTGGA